MDVTWDFLKADALKDRGKRRNIRYCEKNKECQFFKDQGQCGAGERGEAQMVSFISSRRLRDISLLSLCLIESEAIC